MTTTSRFLGMGIALGLAAGLLVGVGLAQPGRAAATTPSALPSAPSGGAAIGAPALPPAMTTSGTAVASSGTAIAYPYLPGSPGIAPDRTIVVTGVGQADERQPEANDLPSNHDPAMGPGIASGLRFAGFSP